MPKDDRVYVGHIIDTARKALDLLGSRVRADFDADEALRLALAHLMQIIGEAARRLSPEFTKAHADVPWSAIVGMRHRIVHDYLSLDEDILWRTVTVELEPLLERITRLVHDPD